MPTPNAERLSRVLAHIEADPEHWNQTHYASQSPTCGTAYCFAGWAVRLEHPRANFIFSPISFPWDGVEWGSSQVVLDPAGEDGPVSVSDVAQELLCLGDADADTLFNAANDLDDLRWMVAALIEGRSIAEDGE